MSTENPGRMLYFADEPSHVILPPMDGDFTFGFTWTGIFNWIGDSSGYLIKSGSTGHLFIDKATSTLRFYNPTETSYVGAIIEPNSWYSFGAVGVPGGSFTLFVNGQKVDEVELDTFPFEPNSDTLFGKDFIGFIDNFALFSFAFNDVLIPLFQSRIPSWFSPVMVLRLTLIPWRAWRDCGSLMRLLEPQSMMMFS